MMENNFKNNILYMYNWITLVCTWNIVSQLYLNKKIYIYMYMYIKKKKKANAFSQ